MRDDWAFWDGHNLLIVVFLLIFVVGLSCGLLGFICTKLIEDFQEEVNPSLLIGRRIIQRNELLTNAPTKIIVTRPPTDPSRDTTPYDESSLGGKNGGISILSANDNYLRNEVETKRNEKRRLSSARRVSPEQKVIYSCENSPLSSPVVQKIFLWSKSSNYDLRKQNSFDSQISQQSGGSDKSNKSNKSNSSKKSSKSIKSPLGVFNHFKARVHSAPMRPVLSRCNSVLHI